MKRILSYIVILVAVLGLAGCWTLRDAMEDALVKGVTKGGRAEAAPEKAEPKENPKADVAPVADFKPDEVLATGETGTMMECGYAVAKVLTPASNATKNQSEVLYMRNGSKEWSKWVLSSRKAEKGDFKVGAVLLFPAGWQGYDNLSGDDYRNTDWRLGRVTATDDLFKNRVSIAGESFNIAYVRTPTTKIQD